MLPGEILSHVRQLRCVYGWCPRPPPPPPTVGADVREAVDSAVLDIVAGTAAVVVGRLCCPLPVAAIFSAQNTHTHTCEARHEHSAHNTHLGSFLMALATPKKCKLFVPPPQIIALCYGFCFILTLPTTIFVCNSIFFKNYALHVKTALLFQPEWCGVRCLFRCFI